MSNWTRIRDELRQQEPWKSMRASAAAIPSSTKEERKARDEAFRQIRYRIEAEVNHRVPAGQEREMRMVPMGEALDADGGLHSHMLGGGQGYVDWVPGQQEAILDGPFTSAMLRSIAAHMDVINRARTLARNAETG